MQNTLRAEQDKLRQFENLHPTRLFIVGGLRPANHLQVGYGSGPLFVGMWDLLALHPRDRGRMMENPEAIPIVPAKSAPLFGKSAQIGLNLLKPVFEELRDLSDRGTTHTCGSLSASDRHGELFVTRADRFHKLSGLTTT
jgi:hypothetical protein